MICMAASGPSAIAVAVAASIAAAAAAAAAAVPFLLLSAPVCKVESNQIGYILSAVLSARGYTYIYRPSREIRESGNARLCHEILFVRFEESLGSICASLWTIAKTSFPFRAAASFRFPHTTTTTVDLHIKYLRLDNTRLDRILNGLFIIIP